MNDAPMCSADPAAMRRELAALVEELLAGEPVWYRWGGYVSASTGLDCSGLVCWAARRMSTPLPLGRPDTDALWRDLEPVATPEPGDLALYGSGRVEDPASHVMVVLGTGADGHVRVAGMSGGGSKTITIEDAKRQDARLKEKPTHLYRRDFIGFRRLPFHLAPGVTP